MLCKFVQAVFFFLASWPGLHSLGFSFDQEKVTLANYGCGENQLDLVTTRGEDLRPFRPRVHGSPAFFFF